MKITYWIITAGAFCFFAPKTFCQTNGDDAKDIFLAEKCQRCHSIAVLDIVNTGQKDISDLSAVGSDHSAAWLIRFLNREEAVNGKKHLKNLKTSGTDIEKLANWLATLKGK